MLRPDQLISGNRSTNADVSVTVNTSATLCTFPDYPTETTWECLITDFGDGENMVTVIATDGVDTTSPLNVVIDYQPRQYANSIAITNVLYTSRKTTLNVDATSDYQNANLMVEFAGATVPMAFEKLFKGLYLWSYTDTNVSSAPTAVTVSGSEGSVTVPVLVK